jgi:hypothetical protein
MMKIWQAVKDIVARLFGRTATVTDQCGYCDVELTGQPIAHTDRYDVVCAQHIEHGEIGDDEAELIDPDVAYEIRRDAELV